MPCVTLLLSGLPRYVSLADLSYSLDSLFDTNEIDTFIIRPLPNHPKTHQRQTALDFRSGFDAMAAQERLDGYQYELADGQQYTLSAKINLLQEYMRKDTTSPERWGVQDRWSEWSELVTMNRAHAKLDARLELLKKEKLILEKEREILREKRRLREYKNGYDSGNETTASKHSRSRSRSRSKEQWSRSRSKEHRTRSRSKEHRSRSRQFRSKDRRSSSRQPRDLRALISGNSAQIQSRDQRSKSKEIICTRRRSISRERYYSRERRSRSNERLHKNDKTESQEKVHRDRRSTSRERDYRLRRSRSNERIKGCYSRKTVHRARRYTSRERKCRSREQDVIICRRQRSRTSGSESRDWPYDHTEVMSRSNRDIRCQRSRSPERRTGQLAIMPKSPERSLDPHDDAMAMETNNMELVTATVKEIKTEHKEKQEKKKADKFNSKIKKEAKLEKRVESITRDIIFLVFSFLDDIISKSNVAITEANKFSLYKKIKGIVKERVEPIARVKENSEADVLKKYRLLYPKEDDIVMLKKMLDEVATVMTETAVSPVNVVQLDEENLAICKPDTNATEERDCTTIVNSPKQDNEIKVENEPTAEIVAIDIDSTERPIPKRPQFILVIKALLKDMSKFMDKNLMNIETFQLKYVLRQILMGLVKGQAYMPTGEILSKFRAIYPKANDEKFIQGVIEDIIYGKYPGLPVTVLDGADDCEDDVIVIEKNDDVVTIEDSDDDDAVEIKMSVEVTPECGPKPTTHVASSKPGSVEGGPANPGTANTGPSRLGPDNPVKFGPANSVKFGPANSIKLGPANPVKFRLANPVKFGLANSIKLGTTNPRLANPLLLYTDDDAAAEIKMPIEVTPECEPEPTTHAASSNPSSVEGGPANPGTANTDPSRLGPANPVKFGPANSIKLGPANPLKFGPANSIELGPANPVKFEPANPVKFGPANSNKFGPANPVKFGPANSNKFGPANPVKFGPANPVKLGPASQVKFGPANPLLLYCDTDDAVEIKMPIEVTPECEPELTTHAAPSNSGSVEGGPANPGTANTGPSRLGPAVSIKLGPANPVKLGPANPVKLAPANPVKLGPANPVKVGPANPVKVGPANPIKLGTANPVKVGPANPVKLGPANPVKLGPANPVKVGPANPVKVGPANPVKVGPANPVKLGTANPVKVGPANPVKLGPANPVKLGPANPVKLGPANSVKIGPANPLKLGPANLDRTMRESGPNPINSMPQIIQKTISEICGEIGARLEKAPLKSNKKKYQDSSECDMGHEMDTDIDKNNSKEARERDDENNSNSLKVTAITIVTTLNELTAITEATEPNTEPLIEKIKEETVFEDTDATQTDPAPDHDPRVTSITIMTSDAELFSLGQENGSKEIKNETEDYDDESVPINVERVNKDDVVSANKTTGEGNGVSAEAVTEKENLRQDKQDHEDETIESIVNYLKSLC